MNVAKASACHVGLKNNNNNKEPSGILEANCQTKPANSVREILYMVNY